MYNKKPKQWKIETKRQVNQSSNGGDKHSNTRSSTKRKIRKWMEKKY